MADYIELISLGIKEPNKTDYGQLLSKIREKNIIVRDYKFKNSSVNENPTGLERRECFKKSQKITIMNDKNKNPDRYL